VSRLAPALCAAPIAWIGRQPPPSAAHELTAVPNLEAAVSLRPLPQVLVYDAPEAVPLEAQLATLSAAPLRPLTVLLAIDHAHPEVLGHLAAAGVFCALVRSADAGARDRVLQLATDHAGARRRIASEATAQDLLARAGFVFRTLEEAEALATVLATYCPEPRRRVGGLLELLVNAVEHGNLELSGAEKHRLLVEGRWYAELLSRLEDPRFAHRRVRVTYERAADHTITVAVEDDGAGFDWTQVSNRALEDGERHFGRGLALARRMSFDELVWEGRGNRVVARIHR
jgi:Histidine kinase-like ATPase domain